MRAQMGLFLVIAVGLAACGGANASPTLAPSSPSSPASQTPVQTPEPSASAVATPAPSVTIYVIRKGDTLVAIAKKFHITLKALRATNPGITDPTLIQIGQKLVIPAP